MDITVVEIQPSGEFGGHVFEYDRGDDLFVCINPGCGIPEIIARRHARQQGIGEIAPCPAADDTTPGR